MLKSGGNHVSCFTETLKVRSEKQDVVCYRKVHETEHYLLFFSCEVFDRAPYISGFLSEGRLKYLFAHIFGSFSDL